MESMQDIFVVVGLMMGQEWYIMLNLGPRGGCLLYCWRSQ